MYFVDDLNKLVDFLTCIYIYILYFCCCCFSLKEIDENLNFDEQILEAAKSIMNAAGALINAATSAQKEIATQVKVRIHYLILVLI